MKITKNKRCKIRFLAELGVLFVLFFARWTGVVEVQAAPDTTYMGLNPVSGSGVTIDAEGNMFMTTHDRIATSSTKYETLGWIIKRSKGMTQSTENICVKLSRYKPTEVDPENSAYCYDYYMLPKELLYQKIVEVSQEWANDLYQNGGILYLDAVMTVKENGVSQGWLSDSGEMSGEVYTTYEGISEARRWADKEALRTHFDKEIYFGGNPILLEQNQTGESVEYIVVSSEIGPGELPGVNMVWLMSTQFDVTQAIPSGEPLTVNASLQKYYYNAIYERHYGTMMVPVTARISYELQWNDGTLHTEKVTVTEACEVAREYSYWQIRDLYLCYLDQLQVENEVLPNGSYTKSGIYQPDITLIKNHGDYIQLPATVIEMDGGVINGGSRKPEIPELNLQLVDALVGEILVKNDTFAVDGEVWMSGEQKEKLTDRPTTLAGKRTQQISSPSQTIPKEKKNLIYATTATAIYRLYEPATGFSGTEISAVTNVNAVSIHTPVLCEGIISDEKEFNQQLVPTEYESLILGREITVSVQTAGTHIDKKGYGIRDYKKYAEKVQVCFPFPVIYEEMCIEADTWITLKREEVSFLLPVSVTEGDYKVRYRCIAYNTTEELATQERYANLDQENYVAYDMVNVSVVGRLSDFQITNVVDYPKWQSVFWKEDGMPTGNVYYAGTNDRDGIMQREETEIFLLPVLAGKHTSAAVTTAPGLGYHQEFSIQTIGNMDEEEDVIWIYPTFYFMKKDGTGRREVHLYRRENLEQFGSAFALTAEDREITADGVQQWNGTYQIPPDVYVVDSSVDLKEYVKQKIRIKTSDEVFLKNGYIVVHFEIQTCDGGMPGLSYENHQNWKAGYCNMWEVEGYQRIQGDVYGATFLFRDGEVMVFDQAKNMLTDYEVLGTH